MGVTGIGGFFFRSKDPEATRAWYVEHLGVGSAPYGEWETQAGPSVFAPFAADTDYFAADRQWMLNLRVDDLDGLCATLRAAGIAVTIKPEWNGPPPPANPFNIHSVQGCDIQPIDVRDDAAANRLMAYIWPEMPERFERMEAGIAMIRQNPVDLVQADAADFVEAQLAKPQAAGTTRVLMHSIVWQYLPDTVQRRIQTAMAAAGEAATAEKPLAWISLETNRATFRHELKVSYWPGCSEPAHLGEAHAHGIWVNWLTPTDA